LVVCLVLFRQSNEDSYSEGAEDPVESRPSETPESIEETKDVVTRINEGQEALEDAASPERASTGLAIPFAALAVTELEEVDLTDASDVHSHKIREWRGRIQPGLLELRAQLAREGEDGVIAFNLPDATQIKATRLRYESYGSNQGVFTGKILGDRFGEIILSYVNQAVAGSIHDYRNDNVWEIRNAGDGRQYIAQVDVTALGECGVCKEHAE
jgi:hypothetical protein